MEQHDSASAIETAGRQIDRFNKLLDRNPLKANAVLLLVFFPLMGGAALLRPLVAAVAMRQGLVLGVAYQAIRATAEWLSDLTTFLQYVQAASTAKLEAEKRWSTAGAYLVLGYLAALLLGVLEMAMLIAVAEPLLAALSVGKAADAATLLKVGLSAQKIIAPFIPARVLVNLTTGSALGQSASSLLLVAVSFGAVFVTMGVGVGVQIYFFNDTGCEGRIQAASSAAYESASPELRDMAAAGDASAATSIFDPDAWVCPAASAALDRTAAIQVIAEWAATSMLTIVVFTVARRRGYFTDRGCSVLRNLRAKESRADAWMVLRSNFGVAVRSILNNTRSSVSAIVAVQHLTATKAAVFLFFQELGTLAYAVPNVCAFGIMLIGSRLLGQRRLSEYRTLMNIHRAWAFVCAAIFTVLTIATETSAIEAFTNVVDRAAFLPEARRVYPLAIALQPLRCLVAVYGPMLMGTQHFVAWGAIVVVCFFLAFLPATIAAAYYPAIGVELLIGAELAYHILHVSALYISVHFVIVPRILRDGVSSYAEED